MQKIKNSTMKTDLRSASQIIPDQIKSNIYSDVKSALDNITTIKDSFIVNPTVYRSESNLNPRVTNSANFLSERFQNNLRNNHGWSKEEKIIGQKIDAFKEYEVESKSYYLNEKKFREIHQEYWRKNEGNVNISEFTRNMQNFYYDRRHPELIGELSDYRSKFNVSSRDDPITYRVGLEFETGNIASSFRSLTKLTVLYREGKIDLGVFVATSRKAATTIWPPSNRNGSFEELENRHYRNAIVYPIMEVMFEPDGYSKDAPFLGSDGKLYQIEPTGETVTKKGSVYQKYKGGGSTFLKEVN